MQVRPCVKLITFSILSLSIGFDNRGRNTITRENKVIRIEDLV
jgi:hypothetical protein